MTRPGLSPASRISAALALLALLAMPARAAAEPFPCPDLPGRAVHSTLATPVHQGSDGWFFRAADFETHLALPAPTRETLRRLVDALRDRGTRLVLLVLPPRALTRQDAVPADLRQRTGFDPVPDRRSFELFLGDLRGTGAVVVDTAKLLDDPAIGDFYFRRDIHWRPEGARMAALAVRDALAALPDPSARPGKRFSMRLMAADAPLDSAMRTALLSLCEAPLPGETLPLYESALGDASLDDLLAAEEPPAVALVGTSFSDERKPFGFAGFLREVLQAEVANHAISGGGVTQSLYGFLHDAAPLPRLLLWELPFAGRIDEITENFARQLVPAARGPCSGARRLAEQSFAVAAGEAVRLDVDPSLGLTGRTVHLAMTLSDPSIRNLVALLRYDDGEEELVTIARPDRVAATPHVFLELSPDFPGNLATVEVRALGGGDLSGTISLCRVGPLQSAEAAR